MAHKQAERTHRRSGISSVQSIDCGPIQAVNRCINLFIDVAAAKAMIGTEAGPVTASIMNDDNGDSFATCVEE